MTRGLDEILAHKRDGLKHTEDEIRRLVLEFSSGAVPDYQMSAWLMAAFIRGLDPEETVWLTRAMVDSGETLDLSSIPGVKVDKHSTGGVADTTTLVVAPLVAACGVPVAKMSGRGLGHTGGTLDKLEAIPGFRVELTPQEFKQQVATTGIAVIAQSPSIDPADKKIYALRDVTATVPSIPLIVGSIISKKIAGGAEGIVIDVKTGSGAFMRTPGDAARLGRELARVGHALGRDVQIVVTDMNQPLGMAVGNALEVVEAIEVLSAQGPRPLIDVSLELAARMLVLGKVARTRAQGADIAARALSSGEGLRKMAEWIEAQGGDPRVVTDTGRLPHARHEVEVRSRTGGIVEAVEASEIGRAATMLGAGRETLASVIDPAAGIVMAVRLGDCVERGDLICTLHTNDLAVSGEASARVLNALTIGDGPHEDAPLFYDIDLEA